MENLIANRIKNARILKCMSQQDIADELEVSKQMISKYEKGEYFDLSFPQSLYKSNGMFAFFYRRISLTSGPIGLSFT